MFICRVLDQLVDVMNIEKRSLQNMISEDRCPIKTVGNGKLRRANIVEVAKRQNMKNPAQATYSNGCDLIRDATLFHKSKRYGRNRHYQI